MTQIYAPGTEPNTGRGQGSTPAHLLTQQAQGVPDDPVRLREGWTPCAVCGQAAPRPTETNGRVQIVRWAPASTAVTAPMASFVLTRCDDCQQVHLAARALVESHPALAARLGPERAVEVAESVLVALTVLGRPTLVPSVTDRELALHVRHLGLLGGPLSWQSVARAGVVGPFRWSHVRQSGLVGLRKAYAELLRERVSALNAEQDVALSPPAPPEARQTVPVPTGCLFCGVGVVAMKAADVQRLGGRQAAQREVWTAMTLTTESVGGRPSPDRLSGHLCLPCAEAVEWAGSIGPASMTRSLLEHMTSSPRQKVRDRADQLLSEDVRPVGWGALAASALRGGQKPPATNTEPWGHLDLG